MKLGIKALACGILALAHLGLAAAGPIEDPEGAFNRGDYVTAKDGSSARPSRS